MTAAIAPLTLAGPYVRLEPLDPKHAADLARHAEADLFRWMATGRPLSQTQTATCDYIERLVGKADTLPFAIVLPSGEAVGVTTYMDVRPRDKGLEIGRTWLARAHQRTLINPQCKLLLMEHAFERLGYVRVQLKTDLRNTQSQRAIEKLGAVREGVLRKHMVMPDGFIRDTVLYSVIVEEWPAVRARLLDRLGLAGA